jgi:uncharacterized membrane protein (DUF2068 family)
MGRLSLTALLTSPTSTSKPRPPSRLFLCRIFPASHASALALSASVHPPHRPSTGLRAVATLEALKGVVVLAVGFGTLSFLGQNTALLAEHLVTRLHLNPASHYPQIFIHAMAEVNNTRLWWIAIFSALYATVRFVEAYGLWKARRWAEWLAALSGAIYIPFELYEIAQHPNGLKVAALLINVVIVAYMVRLLATSRHPSSPASRTA